MRLVRRCLLKAEAVAASDRRVATQLFVRCGAHWRALGYRALVSPSLVIRDPAAQNQTPAALPLCQVSPKSVENIYKELPP